MGVDNELAAWAREVRGAENLEVDERVLEEIREFLQSHVAESSQTATHTILENYPDWWAAGRKAPAGLKIEQPQEVEELFRHIGTLFSVGIPLTLAERRTQGFRLFQDIEAWGTRETTLKAEDILGPDCCLSSLFGKTMGEIYPGRDFLDVAIFDATGMSQTKGTRKTSLRMVWPGLVVDAERAARIRDVLVHRLTIAASEGGPIADLETRFKDLNQVNAWHSVVSDAAYGARAGVRMPLCDRVSPMPLRAPERRPFLPVGVLRFTFTSDGKMKPEWLCRQTELDNLEWLKIGSLRQSGQASLTDWEVPSYPGGVVAPLGAPRGGRVKVRTAGGSEGSGGMRLRTGAGAKPPPERAGQLVTVQRRFNGTVEQFCEQMEQHMGKWTVEVDGSFVWKQPGGNEARIVLFTDDKRVQVIGRPNQVRSLVLIVSPFTDAASADGPGLMTRSQGPGPVPDGRLPSEAYAPAGVTPAAATTVSTPDGADESTGELPPGGQQRVVTQVFDSLGEGELALAVDAIIFVTHDPESTRSGGEDRWVYGRNETDDLSGWFPLSHTKLAEV